MDCCTPRTWATLLFNTSAYVSVQESWGQGRELGKGMGEPTRKVWPRLILGRHQRPAVLDAIRVHSRVRSEGENSIRTGGLQMVRPRWGAEGYRVG